MKKILILSHVLPFPGNSGQQQRIKYTLQSLKRHFHITFVTVANKENVAEVEKQLSDFCDRAICFESRYNKNQASRILHKTVGTISTVNSALKMSNYILGQIEFTDERLELVLEENKFDCVLYEYWHAHQSVDVFRRQNVPCVLDMHNVLWQSYIKQQDGQNYLPRWWKQRQLRKYTAAEKQAWNSFDGIIAINREEEFYVKEHIGENTRVFYAPMGIDLNNWKFDWQPETQPQRVAYYGGLSGSHNQQSALDCFSKIMPVIWKEKPDTELWIIGSNPPEKILSLPEQDERVKVTGFVEDVKKILKQISVVVCPWKGLYGFRSRLVEVMASGVPLVTTSDAVYGMELENEQGVLLGEDDAQLADKTLRLLQDSEFAAHQSKLARQKVEKLYSIENTYDKLSVELCAWLDSNKVSGIT